MPVEHSLPFERSLFIATPNAIHLRSQTGANVIFECESAEGITNARVSTDNSSLIAIADSQVVLLHDTARKREKRLRLKGGGVSDKRDDNFTCVLILAQGQTRLLLFSPDSRTLFFTTTLSTSIQAYSIPTGDLLPPLQSHPSPPTVIAISSDGNILLSASPEPPTTFLHDRRWGSIASVKLQPTDTPSAVTCAAFQSFRDSEQPSYTQLALGFRDGTLALYRVTLPHLSPYNSQPSANQTNSFELVPARVGAMEKLHKAAMGGVTAVAFVPGYMSRVVSIGHDGRCRLIDFEGGGNKLRT